MIYFLPIFLLLLMPVTILVQRNLKWKEFGSLGIFIFFAGFELLLAPLTIFSITNFEAYSIVVWIILSLFIGVVVSLLFFSIYKEKLWLDNLKYIFKKYALYYLVIAIISIVLMFNKAYFIDTNAYINLSSFFKKGLYTFNGSRSIGIQYRTAASYYVYSVFSSNAAPFFLFFTTYVYTLLITSILYDFLINNFKNKYAWIINPFAILVLGFSITGWGFSTNSGNLLFQAAILVYVYYFFTKYSKIYCFIPMLTMQFFSPTGALLTTGFSIIMLIYFLLFENYKNFGFALAAFFLVNTTSITMLLNSQWGWLGMAIVACLIFTTVCLACWKWNLKHDIINHKIKWHSKYIYYPILCLSLIALVGNFALYGFVMDTTNYQGWLVYVYLFLFGSVLTYFFYHLKKHEDFNLNLFFIILASFVCFVLTIVILLSSARIGNDSTYRTMYLNLGMGTVNDIFVSIVLIGVPVLKTIRLKDFTLFNKIEITSSRVYRYSIGLWSVILLTGSIITPIILYEVLHGVSSETRQEYTPDISRNLAILNKTERDDIKSFVASHAVNGSTTYIADFPVASFVGTGKDITWELTQDFNNNTNHLRSYEVQTYNFLGSLDFCYRLNDPRLTKNAAKYQYTYLAANDQTLKIFMEENIFDLNQKKEIQPDYFFLKNDSIYYQTIKKEVEENNYQALKTNPVNQQNISFTIFQKGSL